MLKTAVLSGLWLVLLLSFPLKREWAGSQAERSVQNQRSANTRQLGAVRGEVTRIAAGSTKGMISITVTPAREFQEVTVLARQNDFVGTAVGRSGESDLLGLLSDDNHDDETITAAELNQGDLISVIYDPQSQNRALEIYLH